MKQLWRVSLDRSYSGPIVSQDRVFTTETRNRSHEVVSAFNRQTGKKLWKTKWKGAMNVPFFARSNGSWIRSTPAFDGERLYVAGMRDLLVCLRAKDGKELWKFDFVKEFGTKLPAFGFVCSPLVDESNVYVQAGGAFVKLNKVTGKVIWKSLNDGGGMYGSAFSSPTMAKIGGNDQILVQTRTTLAGVNPDSGKILWSQKIPAFRGMNILTPTITGNKIFTSSYGGKSFFLQIEASKQEWNIKTKWTSKLQGYMSSPVIINDHLYLLLRQGNFACIDLKSGETKWRTDQRFGKYWSLVAQNDRILALDERGILYLIRANPKKFELLDQRRISDSPTWAHLAVCDYEIFIRELNGLAAYRWKWRRCFRSLKTRYIKRNSRRKFNLGPAGRGTDWLIYFTVKPMSMQCLTKLAFLQLRHFFSIFPIL